MSQNKLDEELLCRSQGCNAIFWTGLGVFSRQTKVANVTLEQLEEYMRTPDNTI